MQLKKPRSTNHKKMLKGLLTTATCALLGTNTAVQAQTNIFDNLKNAVKNQINELDRWKFDTALMIYSEIDRVSAAETIIAGTKVLADDEKLSFKLTFDTLTGASANGAVAQPNVQTFTRPSGSGQYRIKANKTPLDNTFKDTRVQLTGQWTQPLSNNYTWSVGGNISKEYDYASLSANTNIAKDFNQKNTTLSAGVSLAYDVSNPQGGIPKAFAPMVINDVVTISTGEGDDSRNPASIASSDNKTTVDVLFGLTQVINRRMIMQFNYSYSKVDGYLTDPYKVLSVVNNDGLSQQYLYENRPNSRAKQAFFVQSKYRFDSSIVDASYRFMTDDWNINSNTVDLRYRVLLSGDRYIEPHVRYYTQTAADFYQPFLNQGDVLPAFASADYRTGQMDTYTIGVKYGMPMESGNDLAFRLEYYNQAPKNAGFTQPGVLAGQNIYENINAIIAEVSYSF